MIICGEHRYVYVELPRTGSTAIAKELIDQYAGERILSKHSTYREFLAGADDEQQRSFAFSSIRNPLDDAVSRFAKMKSDHSDPVRRKYRVGNRGAASVRSDGRNARGERPERRSLFERLENRKHAFITKNDADFSTFFRRYYWLPYDNWSRLSHDSLDHVVRFEHIQDDFATALTMIGLDMTRPLPVTNRTEARDRDFTSYYAEDLVPRARFVFGPYMRRRGYQFPQNWSDAQGFWSEVAYRAAGATRALLAQP